MTEIQGNTIIALLTVLPDSIMFVGGVCSALIFAVTWKG